MKPADSMKFFSIKLIFFTALLMNACNNSRLATPKGSPSQTAVNPTNAQEHSAKTTFVFPKDANERPKIPTDKWPLTFEATLPASQIPSADEVIPSVLTIVVIGDDYLTQSQTVAKIARLHAKNSRSKDNVHLFYDPSVQVIDKKIYGYVDASNAHHHEVQESDLAEQIGKVVHERKPTKLVLHLAAHGARHSGNICYTSRYTCTLDKNKIWEIFEKLAPTTEIDGVLLVPNSCFNGNLAHGLLDLAKTKALPFPVHIVHSKVSDCEATDWEMPNLIGLQEIRFVSELNNQGFFSWVAKETRLQSLENIATLSQWLSLYNLFYIDNGYLAKQYTLSLIGNGDSVTLRDYLLFPTLRIDTSLYREGLRAQSHPTLLDLVNKIFPSSLRNHVFSLTVTH